MRYISAIILSISLIGICYADKAVIIEKSSGKILLGSDTYDTNTYEDYMLKDAENMGFKEDDVEIKVISDNEFEDILNNTTRLEAQTIANNRERERQEKEDSIKQTLNLTDKDWEDLEGALED